MFESVRDAIETMRGFAGRLVPGAVAPADAVVLVELAAELERLAGAVRTLAAPRAAESGSWEHEGFRSAAHWLAARSGTSVAQATSTLEAARRLPDQPVVDSAVRAGRVSVPQVIELTSAIGVSPAHEQVLVEYAAREPLAILREQCRRVIASAAHEQHLDRYRRVHETRYVRHWTDTDGAFRLDARLTPDAGAQVWAVLERERAAVFTDARRDGRREPYDAYTADAFVRVVTGTGTATGTATVHVDIDHAALVRGHTVAGERCEIRGIGPVPVAVARRLADDSVLKVLVTDGVDVRAVAHAGRTIPAHLRSALERRDPKCVVPGCSVRERLEIHHVVPFALGGPTTLDNLARVCAHHHARITNDGAQLVRHAEGGWAWRGPP
ncbi:MAG TPA: DUF222 domain-containing protein [Acidimicrobiia bacterium]|nr:DUF222 domain-containing protein [Acidimicrobiia bacterium]